MSSSENTPPPITIILPPCKDNERILAIGIFSRVYLIDDKIVKKVPRSESEKDLQPIHREALVYKILGTHPRIAEWLSKDETDYVEIKYYPHSDVVKYIETNQNSISSALQSKWFQQIIEAITYIHSREIIHSDLALRQFFIDDDFNLRLGDFNASRCPEHIALGYEKASHCLPRDYEGPNTEASDIFAMGSTLYELVTGQVPYGELYPPMPG
ncbi:hypothetical protein N7456_011554 [Penicillium angulare]|uniref:Protein kinase domain-containing protein n=1 Tax=Penicillium angulare TaxID=116970 RepID=A0A9W9EU10_9EURO|nr:hypothetical protein N7456_011554 [Penicillium angulare]